MIDSEKIGRAIRTLRSKAGYTQKELADQLFVSPMAVSKWERGRSVPDPAVLMKLSAILDMDVDGLLDGTATYATDRWQGALCLRPDRLPADTLLHDKPLIDYLLSYFLLAGIRELRIACPERERAYIDRRFRGGEALGIRLRFSAPEALTAACAAGERAGDLMFVPEPFFLYGVDLTRFLQRAMQHKSPVVNMASVVGAGGVKLREGFSHYEYCSVPLYFLQSDWLAEGGDTPLTELLRQAEEQSCLQMEPMDKGFLLSPLRSAEDAETVSNLVRTIQELGRYLVCCPFEIAWRRGIIGRDAMLRETAAFPEYRGQLERL